MKAKVTGVTAWQGTPTGGTLSIRAPRYVDSSGNASPEEYSAVLDVSHTPPRWMDALDPTRELYVIVQGPDDLPGVRARFYEVLHYGPTKSVRTEFTRKLISSDLNGLIFDYAMPEPTDIPVGFGDAPLTMRAAQQVIEEGGAVVSEWSDIKVDIAQVQALAVSAAGLTDVTTYAAIPATDGLYRTMDTGRVYQRGGGTITPRPDLDALAPVQLGIVLARQDATLQASLNRAGPAWGREVYLPEGTYDVSALTLPDGVSLRGAGIGRTIITSSTAADIITLGLNCRLRDLNIRRGAANQRAVVDINPGSAYRPNALKRVRLEGFEARRGATFLRPNGLTLTDVEADACWIPYQIEDPQGLVTINKPRITNTVPARMTYGIAVIAAAPQEIGQVIIRDPDISGANNDPTGNSSEGWGIGTYNVARVEIHAPNITNCSAPQAGHPTGGAILLGSQSWGCKVLGGRVTNNRLGVYVEHQPEGGAAATTLKPGTRLGSLVQGVTAAFNLDGGIYLSYAPTCAVTDNIVHDNGRDGIFSDGDHDLIIGNTVYNNWADPTAPNPIQLVKAGIRVYGKCATIANNKCYDNQAVPTQQYGIAVGQGGHILTGNSGTGNVVGLLYEGPSGAGTTPNLKFDLDARAGNLNYVGTGYQLNNPASAQYALIATLPATTAGDPTKLLVDVIGGTYSSATACLDRMVFGTSGGFGYQFLPGGSATGRANLSVVAYRQADNTVQVYVRGRAAGFTHGYVRAHLHTAGFSNPVPAIPGAAASTVPSGTLVFDSGDPAYAPTTTGAVDVPLGIVAQQNNAAQDMYHSVTTLSRTALGKLVVELLGGDYGGAGALRAAQVTMNNHQSWQYVLKTVGGTMNAAVVAYLQADNSVQVYVRVKGSTFTQALIRAYILAGNYTNPVPITPGAASATVPGGTLVLDTSNSAAYPANADLGVGKITVGGNQVLAARQAAIANATDAASTQTQLNAVLAALRAHGLIAP